jgi:enamine deaminase RidA (YjgF/YER057c/UK114 family)
MKEKPKSKSYAEEYKVTEMTTIGRKSTKPLVSPGFRGPFAEYVIYRFPGGGGLVFLSGVSGRDPVTGEVADPTDLRGQTIVALEKMKKSLEEAGSGLEHILQLTYYVKDMGWFQQFRDIYMEYYRKNCPQLAANLPASTAVQTGSLFKQNVAFEITAVAALPD